MRLLPPAVRGPAVAFGAFGAFWGAWGAALPDIQRSAAATEAELGLALLCIGLAALPAMLVVGRLADRMGGRVLAPALVAFGLAAALPGLATSAQTLAAALLLLGASSGAVDVAMNTAVATAEAGSGRRFMHTLHATFSLSVLAASVCVGLLRRARVDAALILLVVAGLVMLAAAANRRGPGPSAGSPAGALRLRLESRFVVLGGLCAIAFLLENALQSWSALYLEAVLGAAPDVGGLGPGLFAAAMFAGRALAQAAGRRLADGVLIAVAGLGAAAGMTIAALATRASPALGGFLVAGLGLGVVAPTLFGAAGRAAGEGRRGAAVSTVTTVGYLGFLAGPPLVGGVAEVAGLRGSLALMAALGLLLAACSPALRRPGATDAALAG